MTFYEWIRHCLGMEAIRTETDTQTMLQKIREEITKWKKKK